MRQTRGTLEEARSYILSEAIRLAHYGEQFSHPEILASAAMFAAIAAAMSDPDESTIFAMQEALHKVTLRRLPEIQEELATRRGVN